MYISCVLLYVFVYLIVIIRHNNNSNNTGNHQLENVQCYKYSGLLLSSDLSWSHHIQSTCTKARKLLGLLYRQFSNNTNPEVMVKLSITIVRPHLEYGAQVWHPYLSKDIDVNALEKVQKFGLRICSRQWTKLNVIRSCLNFFIYHQRIEGFSCHCLFFKIIHNLVYFPTIHYPTPLSSFSSRYNHMHDHQLCGPFARTIANHLKYSFLPNSVSLWNNLPSQAVTCTTLSLFKYYTIPLFSQCTCTLGTLSY